VDNYVDFGWSEATNTLSDGCPAVNVVVTPKLALMGTLGILTVVVYHCGEVEYAFSPSQALALVEVDVVE
jgi:hypothetical protein